MGLLKKIFGGAGERGSDERGDALWLYVQCDRCGTALAVRVDRKNEMMADYENGGSILRKEMMDGVCFQLMHAELHLDDQGRITDRVINHGKFLTRAEYESYRSAQQQK